MKYLMTMEPLEPYTFGTDHGFAYPGEKTGRESYFVTSNAMPAQTTVIGMLRYLILKDKGVLKSDYCYSADERTTMERLIGKESFSFETDTRNLGIINSVSSVIIRTRDDKTLIPCPFCIKQSGKFMKMSENTAYTGFGEIHLPAKADKPSDNEYVAKHGYYHGFYNIDDGTLCSDDELFKRTMMTGNNKNDGSGSLNPKDKADGGFFRTEKVSLKKGYKFACVVDLDEALEHTEFIGHMGRGKASFLVRFEADDIDLEQKVKCGIRSGNDSGAWYYCLSDVFLKKPMEYHDFAIVETTETRNLETEYSDSGRRLRKSEKLFKLISRGSVFYRENPITDDPDIEKYGYNCIIEIGGNN